MRDRPIESDEQFLDYVAINMLGGADFSITTAMPDSTGKRRVIVRQAHLIKPGATPEENEIILKTNDQLTEYFRNIVLPRHSGDYKKTTDLPKKNKADTRGSVSPKKKIEF